MFLGIFGGWAATIYGAFRVAPHSSRAFNWSLIHFMSLCFCKNLFIRDHFSYNPLLSWLLYERGHLMLVVPARFPLFGALLSLLL